MLKSKKDRIFLLLYKLIVLMSSLFLYININLYSYEGDGGVPGAFINWGAGARSLAMGKAFSAVADDASAAYWNPAGLPQVERKEFMALHANLWEGTIYDFAAYVHPTTSIGTYGFTFTRLYSGGFEATDLNNNVLYNFADEQIAFSGSYGKQMFNIMSIGVGVSYITHKLDKSVNGFASLDTSIMINEKGIAFINNENFKIKSTIILKNLISIKTGDTDDQLPIIFKFGLATKTLKDKLNISMDLEKIITRKTSLGWHIGIEYWLFDYAAIRLGYDRDETTAGFGAKYKDYGLDYAFALHELGVSHRISATMKFGASVIYSKQTEINKFYKEGIEAYRHGSYLVAFEKLNKAYEIDPQNQEIKTLLNKIQIVVGTIQMETGLTQEADLTRKGVNAYVEGDMKQAVSALKYSFTIQPENERLRQLLKRVELEAGDEVKEELVPKGMTYVEKKLYDALESFYAGKYDLTIAACQEVLTLEPNNITALMRLGSSFFAIGQKAKAKEYWSKIIQIDPTNEQMKEFLQSIE